MVKLGCIFCPTVSMVTTSKLTGLKNTLIESFPDQKQGLPLISPLDHTDTRHSSTI